MKKLLITQSFRYLLLGLLFFSNNLFSQEILQPTDEKTYTEYMDRVLETLKINDAGEFKNGILYDRVFPVANLTTFNQTDSTNTSNSTHFKQAWNELYKASVDSILFSPHLLKDIAYHFERQNTIQIGIINIDFTTIDSTALKPANLKLEIVNQKVQRKANKNPYIHKHTTVISVLNSETIYGSSVNFEFGKIFIKKSENQIRNLTAYFENNQNFSIIENGDIVNPSITVNFQENGLKEVAFDIEYSNNTFQTTYATFPIVITPPNYSQVQYITATEPFQGYYEPSDCGGTCLGKGEYKVYLANGHSDITKPFIIMDGFDPKDQRKIDGIHAGNENHIRKLLLYKDENGYEQDFVEKLNSDGFDVIILNFPKYVIGQINIPWLGWINIYRDGGVDYIQRNAKVLEALIDEVNATLTNNGSTEKITISGPSMGGLISRYALVEMEQNNKTHNVGLWISFDSPHKGANISIGFQKAVQYFDVDDAKYSLKNPAAKLMLINHYLANTSGLPAGAPGFRDQFQNELDNMGFPQQTDRNIALVNGSITGSTNATAGENMAYADIMAFNGLGRGQIWVDFPSNSGINRVFRFRLSTLWGLITIINKKEYATTSSAYSSLDNSPGGYYDIVGMAEDALNVTFPMWYSQGFTNEWGIYGGIPWWASILGILFVDSAYIDIKDNFTFIPTKSALAFSGSNTHWNENIGSRNLVCTGETPFDSYYAPNYNQGHVTLHNNSVNWLLQEINGNPHQIPSIYGNSYLPEITGENTICNNEYHMYQLSNDCMGNTIWSTSNSLQIMSTTNSTVIVKSTTSNMSSAWIKATFDNGDSVTKHIVGKPYCDLFIFNMNGELETDISVIEPENSPIPLSSQDITDYVWTQTGGDGYLDSINGYPDAVAFNHVIGYVDIENTCGVTRKHFNTNFPSYSCETQQYYIESLGQDKYKLVDACNPENTQNVDASELYDQYGVKIQDLIPQQDEVDIDNTSNSGTIRIILMIKDGQVITKMVVTD